ncbi:MAG TPA: GntR family transcriptional regulator [Solirubrobacteraceae bacterium]|nr:GntR family transcriptional regulator [Solirubrobacteraceae bacterium]
MLVEYRLITNERNRSISTSPPSLGSTRSAAVAAELRRLILSGELKPGERLRQVELAERFNVSTTPVREAFTALVREGLVRHDVQRGVVVFTPTASDVRENYEIRLALEPLATELAAKSITDQDLARLEGLIGEMRRALGDQIAYQPLNREFHRTIYAAAERPRLFELIESLRDAFEAYIGYDSTTRPDRSYHEMAHTEHEAIAKALAARAPKRARKLMTEHLSHNLEHYMSTLDEGSSSA